MERKKINKLLACTALVSSFLCFNVQAKEIDTNMAQMQAMDKITGRVSVIDVPVNGDVKFGSFSIVVRACRTRPPEETPENFAFVDVVDDYNRENPKNIFKGWMMSSIPALNPVEHPIYDVWLLKCIDGNVESKKLLSAEQLKERDEVAKAPNMAESLQYSTPDEVKSPEDNASNDSPNEAKTDTKTPDVASIIPSTIIEEKTVPTFEVKGLDDVDVTKMENVEPVAIVDDGSPKSLINFKASETDIKTPVANVDTQVLENAAEAAIESKIMTPDIAPLPQALVVPDNVKSLVIDESLPDVSDIVPSQGETLIETPSNDNMEAAPIIPHEEQLIEFGEVEEEPLDMQNESSVQ